MLALALKIRYLNMCVRTLRTCGAEGLRSPYHILSTACASQTFPVCDRPHRGCHLLLGTPWSYQAVQGEGPGRRECLCALQEDGTTGNDSEEEGSAEAKSESLGSDLDSEEDEEEEEAASRRLNVRTGMPIPQHLTRWVCASE